MSKFFLATGILLVIAFGARSVWLRSTRSPQPQPTAAAATPLEQAAAAATPQPTSPSPLQPNARTHCLDRDPTTVAVRFRSAPSTASSFELLPCNAPVFQTGQRSITPDGIWSKVVHQGRAGWISASLVTQP